MEPPPTTFESLIESVESYGKTTIELTKLKALESGSLILVSLVYRLSVASLIFLFVFFLNVGIALFLGEWLGKDYYGFFIVAIIYLIEGIVFHHFLYDWIKKPITDFIFSQTKN